MNITLAQADEHQRRQLASGGIKSRGFTLHQEPVVETKAQKTERLRVGKRQKTQVEREFEVLLSVRKMNKEIIDFVFEGVRLPWGDGMLYKADFAVLELDRSTTLVEVKGDHMWKHAIVRFKGCRAEWKDWFKFEFHQRRKDGTWHQLV